MKAATRRPMSRARAAQLVLRWREPVMSIWTKVGLGLAWGVLCVGAGVNPFMSFLELLVVCLPPFCIALRV